MLTSARRMILIWIGLSCLGWCFVAGDCPKRGKIGGKKVPDVLSLNKDQRGFSATIEIMTPSQETIMVTENYNGAKLYGSVEVNFVEEEKIKPAYYYEMTKELFRLETDYCQSKELTEDTKAQIISTWIVPESVQDDIDLLGSLDLLGPTIFMVYAAQNSDNAQYVEQERIDGRLMDHWFHCFNDKTYLEWWFESETKLPFRFSLESASNSTGPHVYNFLMFNPIASTKDDLVSYPLGYGCYRSAKDQPKLPSFAESDLFSLDAEAMIMYQKPERVILSSLRMMKYQKTYSFEISDGFNTSRIIQNPQHTGQYVVNTETGECNLKDLTSQSYPMIDDNLNVNWPYFNQVGFNLLQSIFVISGSWSNYMGQVSTDSGIMDVWEDDLMNFFESSSQYDDASITYYFPAIDRTKNPHQAPSKIVIKATQRDYISMQKPIPYQIEIVIVDYSESDIEISDRFDVSGCYDGPGEFTWFQVLMSDPSSTALTKDTTQIRTHFEQTLASFIPMIRIPEIVVNTFDLNFYVTAKLLERPPFKFHYSADPGYVITNPTSILIRENLEDCGEICTNNLNCQDFSYCSDTSCRILDSKSAYSSIDRNDNCTWYQKKVSSLTDSVIEKNILASTRSILSQIKTKVNNGEFVLSKVALSAEDMFIVSGPEEIGGIEEEFDDSVEPLKGDEYAVISAGARLKDGSVFSSVSYSDCLKICQDDDDCYSISFCSKPNKECTLSNQTKAELTKSISDKTTHADNCNVLEKSFLTYFSKFSGQSLVKDAIVSIANIDESECARTCYESTDVICKSFDYCTQKESSNSECFLHQFHIIEDTAHEISGSVWDFSKSTCDHYAERHSRDYTHYIGKQFKQGAVKVIREISDVGLERCASDCNNDDSGSCVSFEYCDSIINDQGSSIRSTCRLSSSKDKSSNYASFESTSKTCSVYYNKMKAGSSTSKNNGKDHFGLAMGLGSFFFIAAFVAGIAGSIYYNKRFG